MPPISPEGSSGRPWAVCPHFGRFVRQTPKTEQTPDSSQTEQDGGRIDPEASSTQARRSVSSLCGFIPCCLNQSFFRAVFVSVSSSPYPTHQITPSTTPNRPPTQTTISPFPHQRSRPQTTPPERQRPKPTNNYQTRTVTNRLVKPYRPRQHKAI